MKSNPVAIALLSAMLAACTAQQAAAPAPSTTPAPPVEAGPPPAQAALGKRADGDTTPPLTVFRAFGNEPFWNINVEGATLTLTIPDDQQGMVMQGTLRTLPAGGNHGRKTEKSSVARKLGEAATAVDKQYDGRVPHGERYAGAPKPRNDVRATVR